MSSIAETEGRAMQWSAAMIARALHRDFFNRKNLIVVPNCYWTGYETDLLVVHDSLRLIDVEIKISRADLKADARKDKWWRNPPWGAPRDAKPVARGWPVMVWRHYYCMPADIWRDELLDSLPPNSGVVLLSETRHGAVRADCKRRARPNPDAKPVDAVAAVNLARLASLRMWDALIELARLRETEPCS